MDERFHYRDSNGQRGTIDIYDENTGCFNVLGAIVLIGFLISWIFDGLSDVFEYCEGIMFWMMIIEIVITVFVYIFCGFITKGENFAVPLIITGVISAIIQFLIMLFTIRANTSLGFFNVLGAVVVALFEAFLMVLAGLIVGIIITLIIIAIRAIVKTVKDDKNEDDEVV